MTALVLAALLSASSARAGERSASSPVLPPGLAVAAALQPAAAPRTISIMDPANAAEAGAARTAAEELQAAVPADASRPEPARYQRLYSGAAASAPEAGGEPVAPSPAMPEVRENLTRLLSYAAPGRTPRGIGGRLAEVGELGGVPRWERVGWLRWEKRARPLDAFWLSELGRLEAAVAHIGRHPGSQGVRLALNDLFYSMRVLAGRAASTDALAGDLRWLYGTFGLGD